MADQPVRVRFAPSPTGTLHVGSARTALFNWLFARHHQGALILRIEDTDQKRSNPAFVTDILESLAYLGIQADEGPYYQSRRLPLYTRCAEQLLSQGKAKRHEGAVILEVPPKRVSFDDLIHGEISVEASLFETLVLMKSDGTPTYNFACVVDDADMRISHVIRGDDHIANTPKQVVLYEALGLPPPKFAHIPLIVGADRARLSKRTGATAVAEYRAVGYLPEAFVNYLALLGWSPGGNREYMPPQEMIPVFDIGRVRKTAAQFDQQKLDWLNSQYIKQLPLERLTDLAAGWLAAKGLWTADSPAAVGTPSPAGTVPARSRAWLTRLMQVLRDRLKTLEDLETEHGFFFAPSLAYDEQAVQQFLKRDGIAVHLAALTARLEGLDSFDAPAVEQATRALIAERGLQPKELIHPVRVAVTGRAVSPPLFEVMSVLGQATVVTRLRHAAAALAA